MSEVIQVDSLQKLEDYLATRGNVVVVFSARDWCVPCRRLEPHIHGAAKTLNDYTFLDVDIDHVEGVKENFDIMSVPQVWFYEGMRSDGLAGREIKARTALQIANEILS